MDDYYSDQPPGSFDIGGTALNIINKGFNTFANVWALKETQKVSAEYNKQQLEAQQSQLILQQESNTKLIYMLIGGAVLTFLAIAGLRLLK